MSLPVVPGRPSVPIVERPTTPSREVLVASISLLVLGLGTVLVLIAWFVRAPNPWTWRGIFAMMTAVGAIGSSYAVWRLPSRATLLVGLVVVLTTLLRVDFSGEVRASQVVLMLLTILFSAPLIYAFGRVD